MLVLSRKRGESFMVGRDVRITVLSWDQGKVRIGIEADGSIEVWRQEIYDEIHGGGESAEPERPTA